MSKPPVVRGHLRRPGIDALLEQALQKPLVMVIAGAGYGKTQAVSNYVVSASAHILWLQLSVLDNFPPRLWERFIYAMSIQNKGIFNRMSGFNFPNSIPAFNQFLHLISQNMDHQKKYIVVLDDFHLIYEQEILEFVQNLVIARLPNLSVILIGRTQPLLKLEGMETNGLVQRITEQDFVFTKDEMTQYFELQNIFVSDEMTDTVYLLTDGWIFAIYLIVLSFKNSNNQNDPISSAKLDLYNLIEHEIFLSCSTQLKDLLIKVSLLENLPLGLVRELCADNDSVITELLNVSTFIHYDVIAQSFQLHHLFMEFLSGKRLYLKKNEVRQVYEAAAQWYEKNDCRIDAMLYYEKAENFNKVFDIIVTYKNRTSKEIADMLIGFIDRAPKELLEERPVMLVIRAKKLLNNVQVERAHEQLLYVQKKYEALPPTTANKRILGEVYIVLALICFVTQTYDFVELFKKADAYLPAGSTVIDHSLYLSGGNFACLVNNPVAGEFDKYYETISSVMPYASRVMNGCGYGIEYLVATEMQYSTRDFKNAEKNAYQAIYKARQKNQYDIEHRALFFLIRISVSVGNHARVSFFMESLKKQAEASGNANCLLLFDVAQGWFFAAIGETGRVANWILDKEEGMSKLAPISSGIELIVRARCLFAEKRYYELLAFLEQNGGLRGIGNYLLGRLEVEILRALGLYYCGDKIQALASLKAAYDLACANLLDMPFIEYGSHMRTLVSAAKQAEVCKIPVSWLDNICHKSTTYAKHIAHVTGEYLAQNGMRNSGRPTLSPREKEILVYLCQGLTRREIASCCGLSINTVKTMLQSVFNKLGAVNSIEAVRIAASMGLDEGR